MPAVAVIGGVRLSDHMLNQLDVVGGIDELDPKQPIYRVRPANQDMWGPWEESLVVVGARKSDGDMVAAFTGECDGDGVTAWENYPLLLLDR